MMKLVVFVVLSAELRTVYRILFKKKNKHHRYKKHFKKRVKIIDCDNTYLLHTKLIEVYACVAGAT
jgi:hypothetical protein